MLERDHFGEVRVSLEVAIKTKKNRKPVDDLKRQRRARRSKTLPQQRCLLVHCSRPKDNEILWLVRGINDRMRRQKELFDEIKKLMKEFPLGPVRDMMVEQLDPDYRKS